jgi:signal transduction histidine kinase
VRRGRPRTALEALSLRWLPVSGWPWRSAGYLLTTLPMAVPPFVVLAIPWLVLLARLAAGNYQLGGIVVLVLLGVAMTAAFGPLVAPPLARLERLRLRLVDTRPTGTDDQDPTWPGVGFPRPGSEPNRPLSRLRVRYTSPATWREVAYAWLLGTVAPALTLAVLLVVLMLATFLASPFLILAQPPGGAPVALGFGSAETVAEAVPYAIAGILALPLIPYLLTLAAGGHAAVARALLSGDQTERLRAELVEVAQSRLRLADAFEAERRRIERDLHDGAQQKLVSLTLHLGLARLDLPPDSPAAVSVATAHEQAKQLMNELRQLIHGIRPQILTDLGLPAALGELADQSPVPVTVDADLSGRLPSQLEHTAYFVAAEALTNVAKHSGATSATVTVRQRGTVLSLEIADNGRGGADPSRGSGLTGLADRVAVAGGRLLLSSPDGGPTVLRVELPCHRNQPSSE